MLMMDDLFKFEREKVLPGGKGEKGIVCFKWKLRHPGFNKSEIWNTCDQTEPSQTQTCMWELIIMPLKNYIILNNNAFLYFCFVDINTSLMRKNDLRGSQWAN